MRVSVVFQDEQLALDLPDAILVGSWEGPMGLATEQVAELVRSALEHPLEFPPFRQMVVPGDRVAIALDASLGELGPVLHVLDELLRRSGVDAGDVTVVATPGGRVSLGGELPPGVAYEVHDPGDSRRLAYLATTEEGRRIYLNRKLTDADVVVPVGRLGYDPVLGYRGPWSAVFPGLSDEETAAAYRHRLAVDPPERVTPRPRLDEPFEVSWLLGTQFYMGLVPGASGHAEIMAGLARPVRDQGIRAVDRNWCFQSQTRAECVVVGISSTGVEAGIGDLVEGLVTASRLVNHGGKIVAISHAQGSLGPSLRRLIDAEDTRRAFAALRGHDDDPDSVAGRRLAQVLEWADVYLLSRLDRQVVEDLSMVPLERSDDVRRLVARSGSCLMVSHANLTRAVVHEGSVHPISSL